MTTASIFRVIEAAHPTLMVDEADTFLSTAEETRGVINAGHCRATATVVRCVETPTGYEPRGFGVWGATAIAAIKKLPDTIEDRAIKIAMRRRRPDERVERMRLDRLGALKPLARRAARWAADHVGDLGKMDPDVPDELHDRAADNWRPLLAIADTAGGNWPERARRAAVMLTRDGAEDAATFPTMLLADLRELFAAEPSGVLMTAEILAALHRREDRPWPEYRRGKPITDRQMASLLKPFRVSPGTVRRGATTGKGYRAADLEDAWARYLPPLGSVTPSQLAACASFSEFRSVTNGANVTDQIDEKPRIAPACDVVTDRRAPAVENVRADTATDDENATWTG
jgi:putative DNA primase/helicase